MQVVQEFLKRCDIFGQGVNFNYKKEDTYRTGFGGLASLVIIVVLVVFFQSNVITFFAKTQIFVAQKTDFQEDPDLIELNDENFMIAFQIEQTNFTTNPYFNITVLQQKSTRLDNGTVIKIAQEINLIPCTLDRFQKVFTKYNVDFKAQFDQVGLKNFLCPDYNYSLNLAGRYASHEFDYIKIIVTDCNNNTSQNSRLTWKPNCQTKEAISSFLSKNSAFKVSLYMTNLVMNPTNPKDYATAFLDDELYFTFTPKQLSRQANIFWRKYNFQTDDSLTPFQAIVNETYNVRSATDYRDLTLLGTAADSTYAQFYMRRSTYSENILRNYQKVDDLMSYLGGFLQIMIVFFGFFIQVYNKQSFDLSNELFDFDLDDNSQSKLNRNDLISNADDFDFQAQAQDSNQQQSMMSLGQVQQSARFDKDQTNMNKSQKSIKNPSKGISIKQLNSVQEIIPLSQLSINNIKLLEKHQTSLDKIGSKNGRQYFFEQIQRIFAKTRKLEFTFRFFFQKVFCERMMKNPQVLLLNKAVNQINAELDVFGILDKLHEIDKLKELLLKKPQQIIFNFTPKPLITLQESKSLPSRQRAQTLKSSKHSRSMNNINKVESSMKIQLDQVSKQVIENKENFLDPDSPQYLYSKLFKAYERLMALIENQDEDAYLNNQLIKKLGPQIQNIFEVSWLLIQQTKTSKEIDVNDRAKRLISSKFSKFKNPVQQDKESDGEVDLQDIEMQLSPKTSQNQSILKRVIGKRNSNEF
ncbi:unnamed protein product (macronuclear) [Paramecium tetraurelia]|uniref:Transmembrane protein n=1 Tax=Paramecium tetraurelia TaxID=5888 RepID=A0D7U4_PARTE|nr:uncharacterized protein GSPATT00014078001 [Paramecium tetraurelia]CAK79111.1 unnamed protein product [Paramecium tetraurelia]|eukprot:XP_001446508.1 hypothetical protein (macronuclear) [Paramecium tetraurelia strain d4-2]